MTLAMTTSIHIDERSRGSWSLGVLTDSTHILEISKEDGSTALTLFLDAPALKELSELLETHEAAAALDDMYHEKTKEVNA